jgi:hypothetical protein
VSADNEASSSSPSNHHHHHHHDFCEGPCTGLVGGHPSNNKEGETAIDEEEVNNDSSSTCQIRETLPFPSCMRVTMNPGGWFWAMGIDGKSDTNGESRLDLTGDNNNPMANALQCLKGEWLELTLINSIIVLCK